MRTRITSALLIAISAFVFATPAVSRADAAVRIIEDFEAYPSGIGSWTVVDVSNIASVQLDLGVSNPIQGLKDLRQVLGIGLPGSSYVVENLNLNIPVPASAEYFKYTMKSLVALNLGRTVTITLRDQDNVEHVSAPIQLATLIISTDPVDVSVKLSEFTPPLVGGPGKRITGVKLKFNTSLAGIAGAEQLDSLRFELNRAPAAASGWMLYN